MDSTAIKLIQDTAIDAAGGRLPKDLMDRIVDLPDDYKIHDLETYRPGRERKRGAFSTESLADYIQHVSQTGKDTDEDGQPEVFIDAANLKAKAYFNVGRNDDGLWGHGDHHATLAMKRTAAYTALCTLNGQKVDQKVLAEWLEDWNANLEAWAAIDGSSKGSLSAAIAAVRDIKITKQAEQTSRVGDTGGSRSAFEQVEANANANLPAAFAFTCEPYLGLSSRTFVLRLSVIAGDKPVMGLRIVQKEAHDEQIAQEFKTILFRELGEKATVLIGSFTP